MVDHIVVAMRASPDWGRLAMAQAAGVRIGPEQYMPAHNPRFPAEVPEWIARWDRLSNIPYFECRRRIRAVAKALLSQLDGVLLTTWTAAPALLDRLASSRFVVFYHDDDDWFDPAMRNVISLQETDGVDAIVFPFARVAANVVTFTRDGAPIKTAIGRCEPFRFRYSTNNYGLTPRAIATGLTDLVEHMDASDKANALDFRDTYVETVISATSKTPCSASWLRQLPDDETAFNAYVRRYVDVLRLIRPPEDLAWIAQPLNETIAIFEGVAA